MITHYSPSYYNVTKAVRQSIDFEQKPANRWKWKMYFGIWVADRVAVEVGCGVWGEGNEETQNNMCSLFHKHLRGSATVWFCNAFLFISMPNCCWVTSCNNREMMYNINARSLVAAASQFSSPQVYQCPAYCSLLSIHTIRSPCVLY